MRNINKQAKKQLYSNKKEKINEKNDTLYSAKKLHIIKNQIINAFKKGIFRYMDGFQVEKETDEDTDEEMDTTIMPELESEESN